jgi:multiple sugar transport system substrate-binding protein
MRSTRRDFLGQAVRGAASASLGGSLLSAAGCYRGEPPDGRIHLRYWDKWDGIEGDVMRSVVKAFNKSQDRITVHYTPVGVIDRKLLAATSGGDPPDVAGMWENNVTAFAEQGAINPLDELMKRDGIPRDHWIPVYQRICSHQGLMWAVPTTPYTSGLHYNEALFEASAVQLRARGLDPGRGPATLAELDAYAEVLTTSDARGDYVQMGFLPQEPGWFHWVWGFWFGGKLMDDHDHITANDPLNVEAYEWIQGYSYKYGVARVNRFTSGFGNFASPQNAFFSGKLAMVLHGAWLHNYIQQYAPGMRYGVVPWPKTPHGPAHFSTAGCDILVIPRGLPPERREAAWTFMKYVISQPAMEMLNLGHRKATPLTKMSDVFLKSHPHRYLSLFIEMSKYKDVASPLHMGVWSQYQTEILAAFERVRLLQTNPATGKPYTARESLDITQDRMSLIYARYKKSLSLRPPISGRLS